jgi:quercetin dioxygenase-like cupin family protein
MRVFRSAEAPTGPGDPKTFTGAAQTTRLASDDTATPVHVYRVAFEPGGRTNWHTHSGAQWLFITEGRVRVQVWGQPSQDVAAGDAVVIAPGEKHWHGAAPGSRGVHLAVNINLKTEWLEPVADAGPPSGRGSV